MSRFFADPWDIDDPSQPQSFFGNELRNAARWQAAGWGNPLLSLAAQRSYPGSLVPAGVNFASLAGPSAQAANNNVIELADGQGPADQGSQVTPPQQPPPMASPPLQWQVAPSKPSPVTDPSTGLLIDPSTGYPIDRRTGKPIGPTGLPPDQPPPSFFDALGALLTRRLHHTDPSGVR